MTSEDKIGKEAGKVESERSKEQSIEDNGSSEPSKDTLASTSSPAMQSVAKEDVKTENISTQPVKTTLQEESTHSQHSKITAEQPTKKPIKWWLIGAVVTLLILYFALQSTSPVIQPVQVDRPGPIVEATIIVDSTCMDCTNLNSFIEELQQQNVTLSVKTISVHDAEDEIAIYKLTHLPAIIFSADLSQYQNVHSVWHNFGTISSTGEYVLRYINPPYKDVESGKIRGIVDLTYVTDNSCKTCYDVTSHRQVLEGFGMKIGNEEVIDISDDEGKQLLQQYTFNLVPTVLLSAEAVVYPSRLLRWNLVGSIEEDGRFIFRDLARIENARYRDLNTGEILP